MVIDSSAIDPDDTDQAPHPELLALYHYKTAQLAEIIGRVYNEDDVKKVSAKLAKAERGQIAVSMYFYIVRK